jgi:glycosyltransferase involved in cell wall biosynthesis
MSIIIFGDLFSFPEGNAATNRVHTYAKGFIEHGVSTHVICFANEYRTLNNGDYDGIKYYYPFDQTSRNKYFVIRRFQKLRKYINTITLMKKINSANKIIAINIWTNSLTTHIFAYFLSCKLGTKLLIECSEHPLRNYQKNYFVEIIGHIKLYIESRLNDGILCISNYLINFYRNHGIKENKLLLIPSTVDSNRFLNNSPKPFPFRYIGYFGSLTIKRDNVDSLIKAFAQIAIKHTDIFLILGGFCSEQEKKQIQKLIMEFEINSQVNLLNYLSRQEIIRYMQHSDILVMMRTDDLEAQASYPSKLAEYLATSKPVISVKVGEITDFLTDGVNAFLVEPADINGLAEKLDFVLNNYQSSCKIGERGRRLADTIFNYKVQTKNILNFLKIDELN